jgi:tetratricopeptide (TPR) repeat protein
MEIIQQAIDDCLALVVILSPAAMQSQFVRMEYRYAAKQGKLVIPALHIAPPKTPMDLDILQWVDFQTSYDEGMRQLAQALSRLKPPAPPPTPAKPIIQSTPAPATPTKTKGQWRDEGLEHRKAKHYEEALAAYDQAIRLDPKYALVYVNKGNLLQEDLQRSEEALSAYDQAIKLDQQLDIAHNGRGNALWGLKRHEEALVAYDQVLKLNPQFALAHNGRGNALKDLQRYEEALAAYDQALKLNPQYALAYNNKAISLDALGRKQEAEQARQKARELGYTG